MARTSAPYCAPATPSGPAVRCRRSAGVDEALARSNIVRSRPASTAPAVRCGGTPTSVAAVSLAGLPAARRRTIIVAGHEQIEATGIAPAALDLLDSAVEIPTIGTRMSVNVAVAGSLVLY